VRELVEEKLNKKEEMNMKEQSSIGKMQTDSMIKRLNEKVQECEEEMEALKSQLANEKENNKKLKNERSELVLKNEEMAMKLLDKGEVSHSVSGQRENELLQRIEVLERELKEEQRKVLNAQKAIPT
jgi:chromosome segregation ATPase